MDSNLSLLGSVSAYHVLYEKIEAKKRLLADVDSLKTALAQCHGCKEKQLKAYEAYLQSYHQFLNGQAILLAQQLKENAPCPVCGSLEHPNKAQADGPLITQGQVDKLWEQQDQLTQRLHQMQLKGQSILSSINSQLDSPLDFSLLLTDSTPLQTLRNAADKELMDFYLKYRKDGAPPVFVKARVSGDDYTCYCGMQLSSSSTGKLKSDKMCRCDTCRRIVYID